MPAKRKPVKKAVKKPTRKVTERNKNGVETYTSRAAMMRHEKVEPPMMAKKEGDRPVKKAVKRATRRTP